MRIGFANLFSFRPHIEHLYYLANLLRGASHEVFFLTCDAGVSNCYPRALKGTSKLNECLKCVAGGVRSYPVGSITSISSGSSKLDFKVLDALALSSSCTLNRTESDRDWDLPEVIAVRESLHEPVNAVHQSAVRWIEDNKLDSVICFNGRMDISRALTYACEKTGIKYVTHERTWFGDGLHLIPNANCLSIAAVNKMAFEFQNKPLTLTQAKLAAKLVSERFLQRNSLEWRVYNKNPEPVSWPTNSSGLRVLVLPSSRNEFSGHDEWKSGWKDNTEALDDLFEAFSIKPEQVVVRCHPNWSEKIGKTIGDRSSVVYDEWTKKRKIHCISSFEKSNTYDLIQQADIVVMNGGSAAVEAGVCGKQIICLGPVNYEKAGFVRVFRNRDELYRAGAMTPLDSNIVIRKTLRFIYLSARRFPQYSDHVRAVSTIKYSYFEGASPDRIVSMLKTGFVEADDATYAVDSCAEDSVVDELKKGNWAQLSDHVPIRPDLKILKIERRAGLRWIDDFRSKMTKGDGG